MNKISIYCEFDYKKNQLADVCYELLSKANELKNEASGLNDEMFEIEAVVINNVLDENSKKQCYAAGADKVVLIKNDAFCSFNEVLFANAFMEFYLKNPSRVILFPATYTGRAVAPRITTILNTGLVADCTQVEFILKDEKLKLAPTRPTFGSELMATILSKKLPECATIRPKTFKAVFDYSKTGKYEEFDSTIENKYKTKILKTLVDNSESKNDFSNAKIILAAGFGLLNGKDDSYIKKLKEICEIIGASFASTRKLVDLGITPYSTQVGQTGACVEVQLYIAFGISGAIQHVCGMKNSKNIIAVNTNPDAEIFKYSDYKIIQDAKIVIDELYELVKNK